MLILSPGADVIMANKLSENRMFEMDTRNGTLSHFLFFLEMCGHVLFFIGATTTWCACGKKKEKYQVKFPREVSILSLSLFPFRTRFHCLLFAETLSKSPVDSRVSAEHLERKWDIKSFFSCWLCPCITWSRNYVSTCVKYGYCGERSIISFVRSEQP